MNASDSLVRRSSNYLSRPRLSLVQQQGFAVFSQLVDPETLLRIWQESLAVYPTAQRSEVNQSDGEEHRGGSPARALYTASGGPVQDSFYSAPSTLDFLSRQCGSHIVPSGLRGTYSYYVSPGDYLGIHRDVRTCDVAVITCLQETGERGIAGMTRLYLGRTHESLSEIRKSPAVGAKDLRLRPGETIVMLGGIIPHCILPTVVSQSRVVSVLCYELQ